MLALSERRELAKSRYDEATRVYDAFTSQVNKRREKWRTADPADAAKRRHELAAAVLQQSEAKTQQDAAWRKWHALNNESMGTRA